MQKELENLHSKTFFQKLFNKPIERTYYSNEEIDARLSNCKWVLTFKWSEHNSLSFRMAHLSSAVIAQLTNGVYHGTSDDVWYYNNNEKILDYALRKSNAYESSLEPNDWRVHIMEGDYE